MPGQRSKPKCLLPLLLSLALVACGKSTSRNDVLPKATYGEAGCDYLGPTTQRSLGTFDVQLVQTKDVKRYVLYITPVSLVQLGNLISITVSGADGTYRQLVEQTRLNVGRVMQAGVLSVDELSIYTTLIIAVYQPGINPLESTTKLANICGLVQPGDGVAPQYAQ